MIFEFFKKRRRNKVLSKPFPESHLDVLEKQFPLYNKLPDHLRSVLKDKVKVFLAEKNFEGCRGLDVSEEVRVLVSAQACLLLVGHPELEYSKLKSILIYPREYEAVSERMNDAGIVTVSNHQVLGQSWEQGLVSLSWESTQRGAANIHDGRNVVIHEFAHQLDQEDGVANGLPVLRSRCRYAAWQAVMSQEYGRLRDRVDQNRKTIMDPYGATHPAEFFAVASECFFEKPKQLKQHRPDLYRELQVFYGQNPVEYHR